MPYGIWNTVVMIVWVKKKGNIVECVSVLNSFLIVLFYTVCICTFTIISSLAKCIQIFVCKIYHAHLLSKYLCLFRKNFVSISLFECTSCYSNNQCIFKFCTFQTFQTFSCLVLPMLFFTENISSTADWWVYPHTREKCFTIFCWLALQYSF